MIDYLLTHRRITVSLGVGLLLVLGIVTLLIANQSGPDPFQQTSFYSPIAKTTDQLAINYNATASPNMDAVKQQSRIFAPDSVPLPSTIRTDVEQFVQSAVAQAITPTYNQTYIHISPDSVKCPDENDCRLSLYLDSPEMYFDFHLYRNDNGDTVYTLQRTAMPGVAQ